MPVGCDQIRVLGLPPEALNALGAAEPILNLPENFSLRYTKSREQLNTGNQIETEGVLGFTAPSTPVNDAVFCEYGTPATLDNRRRFYEVQVISAGIPAPFSRLVCKGKDGEGNWDLELRRSPGHWAELGTQLFTNQIDFGEFRFAYDSIEENWDLPKYEGAFNPADNDCTYWPVMDYGGWCDRRELQQGSTVANKFLGIEDLRPLISLPYLLKRGACQIGWTLEGVIFDAEWVRRLWVYALSQTYYDADKVGGRVRLRTFVRSNFTYGPFAPYPTFEEKVIGDASEAVFITPSTPANGYVPGIRNVSQLEHRWAFGIRGNFTNEGGSPITLTFYVQQLEEITGVFAATGEVLSAEQDQVEVTINAGETKYLNVNVEATLRRGIYAALCFGGLESDTVPLYYEKGLFVEVAPVNRCFMQTAGTMQINDMVEGERTWLDWLKGFVHLIRGRVETDFKTKTITVHPANRAVLYSDTVPGYLLEESPDVDYSDRVIEGSVRMTAINPNLKRFTQIEFKDSTDAYIDSLELIDPAHSRKINNGAELIDDIEEITNPVFEPTLEGQIEKIGTGLGGRQVAPWLPRMWDNTNSERSFAIAPRIFFAFGKVRQRSPRINAQNTAQWCGFNWANPANDPDFAIEFFGYATQLRTRELDPTPTIDGNVVFSNQPANLFTQFYLGLANENRGGFNLDFLAWLEPQDYANFNFRNLLRLSFEGRPLRVESVEVSDHEMCGEIPTPIRAVVAPALTACCELPCGCQFSTCEYYQDFGLYLRQATLDTFRLASFVVDGIELITTPLPFGEINVADVDGDPFVTNLVDLLNSVGAPYFAFGISSRLDGERGRRFFTIKKPACQSFKILITADGDEVYMYTQAEQAQKWFSGTWAPFGYITTYDVPENCVITTEY